MIRTAIPFGYSIFVIVMIGGFVLGLALLISGLFQRFRSLIRIGAALSCGVALVFICDAVVDTAIEWNPEIADDFELVGTWADRDTSITLLPDRTFVYRQPEGEVQGAWKRDDWNLRLTSAGDSREMRFIRVAGSYRVITNPPTDFDMWDGDLGLPKKP